jgi:hypothetical protein
MTDTIDDVHQSSGQEPVEPAIDEQSGSPR